MGGVLLKVTGKIDDSQRLKRTFLKKNDSHTRLSETVHKGTLMTEILEILHRNRKFIHMF